MTDQEPREFTGSPVARIPEPPQPTRLTRIEKGTWVIYGLVAVLLLVIPIATHSFSLPDIAAWVLLIATVAMTGIWLRNGALRGPEWLKPEDYERYLKEIQRIPDAAPGGAVPPKPTARLADRVRSDGPTPPR